MNSRSKSKQLAIYIKENEEQFVSGDLDINDQLDETDRLYTQVSLGNEKNTKASDLFGDCDLMKLHTRVAKRCARSYKPDSMVFNAVEFALKVKLYYDQSSQSTSQNDSQSSQRGSQRGEDMLWLHIGGVARKLLYTVPSFSFINGTFDPDPVEVVKKKRKMREKDKLGKATKPDSMSMKENTDNQDMMIKEAERVLGILQRHVKKNEANVVCFYEFVVDPNSFGRTVENIFTLSLLVKEGCVRIIKDRNGLPCLSLVAEKERKERNPSGQKQCIISIGYEEWEDIVKKFKFYGPNYQKLLPPRRSALRK